MKIALGIEIAISRGDHLLQRSLSRRRRVPIKKILDIWRDRSIHLG
jgi:hypothetical protein